MAASASLAPQRPSLRPRYAMQAFDWEVHKRIYEAKLAGRIWVLKRVQRFETPRFWGPSEVSRGNMPTSRFSSITYYWVPTTLYFNTPQAYSPHWFLLLCLLLAFFLNVLSETSHHSSNFTSVKPLPCSLLKFSWSNSYIASIPDTTKYIFRAGSMS
jgi:hypothetical protein